MEYALLRSLRALGPGLLILSYVDRFRVLALHDKSYFWSLESAKLFLLGYAVGGIYGVIANLLKRDTYAFKSVTDAISTALREFAPEIDGRSWNDISPCYYTLIDNDKSLEQKSKGMYFNGFIVTTSFDAIWLSLIAAVFGATIALLESEWEFLAISATSVTVAYMIWLASNARHRELALEQVNVIGRRFEKDFRDCLGRASCETKTP
jgi:hypothetical protein